MHPSEKNRNIDNAKNAQRWNWNFLKMEETKWRKSGENVFLYAHIAKNSNIDMTRNSAFRQGRKFKRTFRYN